VVFSGHSGLLHQKTDHHDITEILLKVALSTMNQSNHQRLTFHLSPQISKHKKHYDIWHWKSRSCTKMLVFQDGQLYNKTVLVYKNYYLTCCSEYSSFWRPTIYLSFRVKISILFLSRRRLNVLINSRYDVGVT
jgi:hypothetical protein